MNMARKIFLKTNDEIAVSKKMNANNSSNIKVSNKDYMVYQNIHQPIYANKSQLQPRMIFEGAEAKKLWEDETDNKKE